MLVEIAVNPKQRPGALEGYCEDLCGQYDNVFWVLDGSSTPKRLLEGGAVADGRWLTQALDAALRRQLEAHPERSLEDLLIDCETELTAQVLARCTGRASQDPERCVAHTSVVLVRVHPTRVDYALVQDSSLCAWTEGQVHVLKDRRQDRFNAGFYAEQASLLRAGAGFAGRAFNRSLDEMVDRERQARNRAGQFIALTGLPGAAAQAQTGTIERTPQMRLLLASDGGARFWEVFEQSPREVFTHALQDVLHFTRAFEGADPSGQRHPRVSAHDDQALLRLSL